MSSAEIFQRVVALGNLIQVTLDAAKPYADAEEMAKIRALEARITRDDDREGSPT